MTSLKPLPWGLSLSVVYLRVTKFPCVEMSPTSEGELPQDRFALLRPIAWAPSKMARWSWQSNDSLSKRSKKRFKMESVWKVMTQSRLLSPSDVSTAPSMVRYNEACRSRRHSDETLKDLFTSAKIPCLLANSVKSEIWSKARYHRLIWTLVILRALESAFEQICISHQCHNAPAPFCTRS